MPPAQHKATALTVQCKDCRGTKVIPCRPGLGGAFLPARCDLSRPPPGGESCSLNPFVVVPDSSKFVDQQTLKLQVREGRRRAASAARAAARAAPSPTPQAAAADVS